MLITFAVFVFVVYNFPWITGYWRIDVKEFVIKKSRRIAFISDVHLGARGSSIGMVKDTLKMLRRLSVDTLVIVGDLINRRFYIDMKDLEMLAIFIANTLKLTNTTIIYILSSSAHDVILNSSGNDIAKVKIDDINVELIYIPHVLKVRFEGCRDYIYATHGDYISRNGVVSYLIDRISRKIFKKLFTGIAARKIFHLDGRSWVILGHSHTPYIDRKYKVVGLGSWVKRYYAPRESAVALVTCKDGLLNVVFKDLGNSKHHKFQKRLLLY